MSGTLTGRSAIVTGAARGIGLAVARLLVRAEARVLLADPDERRLEVEVAALNAAQHRGEATAFCCNLGDRLDMTNLLTAAWEAQGGLDILVDANLLAEPSDLLAPGVDELEATLSRNVAARLRLAQLAARRMQAQEDPEDEPRRDRAILFMSPAPQIGAAGDFAALAAGAAALGPVVQGLALRLAPHGLRVNALAIGVDHPAEDGTEPSFALPPEADGVDAAAEAALFLVSPAARAVTGQTLAADAGRRSGDRP